VLVSLISDLLARLARDAHAALGGVGRAVSTPLGDLVTAGTDAGHAVTLDQHHVGHVNRGLGRDDATRVAAAGVDDLLVLLDAVDALDDHPALLTEHTDHLAFSALVLASDHLDGVALLDVNL